MNFESHCQRIWNSSFFQRLATPYWQHWPRGPWQAGSNELVLDQRWGVEPPVHAGEFLSNAVAQFEEFRRVGFGIEARPRTDRSIRFERGKGPSHDEGFTLSVTPLEVQIRSRTDNGLAQGLFHLERMIELRGAPLITLGRHTLLPRFDLRLHCDVWGGYTVTPRWLAVPHRKETFLLMARHGINATQVRVKLGDFFHDRRYPEIVSPRWPKNVAQLRRIVEEAQACGLRIILHADNFRLPPDHALFRRKPRLKGAPIFRGVICPICTGTGEGLELIARGWENVFREVPGIGGMIAIVGGECFTHCAMRPVRDEKGRNPCPRCGLRHPADVAADLIDAVTKRVHRMVPHAKVLAWPYSAESRAVWNADEREMERFIRRLGRRGAEYVLEIEKEGNQPIRGANGAYRNIWDYSSSFVGPASRFVHQEAVTRKAGVPLCVKTESLQAWEAGFAPYLPIMDHWRRRWTLLRRTRARDIHMGWPLFGFNDAPPMELAAWQLWKGVPNAAEILKRMTERDFGRRAAARVRRSYRLFGEALEMLPLHCMGYYTRIQVIGSANPLLLRKDEPLEDAFLNFHFYEGEGFSTLDAKQIKRERLPYDANLIRPTISPPGRDTAELSAECVRRAARSWERALRLYEAVQSTVPSARRANYVAERRLLRHLGFMWHTWANAEEFYCERTRLEGMEINCYSRRDSPGLRRRVTGRMLRIARSELANSRRAWANVRGDDRLDPSLRLDTPTVPIAKLYAAKFRHSQRLIATLQDELRREQ